MAVKLPDKYIANLLLPMSLDTFGEMAFARTILVGSIPNLKTDCFSCALKLAPHSSALSITGSWA